MALDATALGRLSVLLDQALDLDAQGLERWLATLGDEPLLPELRRLLARHAEAQTTDLALPPLLPPAGGTTMAGSRIGPYRLLRELGSGGMGTVWLAERADGLLQRTVALKLPHVGWTPTLVERFARERQILSALDHPHIARLHDVGVDALGRPYMALEHVDGEAIDAHCRARDLGARSRVQLLLQVADAVAHAHRLGVLHRDLKTADVLVRADGHTKLLDFGIAKLLAGDAGGARTELTQLGMRALTLHCAAPEQLDGASVTEATDVWALGVLLYELVAGQRPFDAATRPDVEAAIRERDPRPPSRCAGGVAHGLRRDAAADLDTIALKALAKAPAARYASADAFAADLRRWLDGEPLEARPEPAVRRVLRLARRHRLPLGVAALVAGAFVVAEGLGAGALVVAALAAGLGVALWQAGVARRQARIAEDEARTAATVQAFIEGVFAANSAEQAKPAAARTRTARELLDDAAARIDGELADAPQVKLRLLRILARLYMDMQEADPSVRMQRRHQALAAALHGADSAANAQALAELGCALAQAEDLPAAREALDAAAVVLARRADAAEDARIALDLGRGMLAYRTDPLQGIEPGTRAVAALTGRPVSAERLIAGDILARCLHFAGRLDDARRVAEEGLAAARSAPERWAHHGNDLRIALARIVADQGDIDAARGHFEQALQESERSVGPAGHQALSCMALLGHTLADHGRLAEGAAWLGRAADALATWPESADKAWQVPIFQEYLGGALARHGRPHAVLACTAEGLRYFDPSRHNAHWAELMHAQRAEACLQLGRAIDARAEVTAAQALLGSDPHPATSACTAIGRAHARCLAAEGRGEEARRHWLQEVVHRRLDTAQAHLRLLTSCQQPEFELAAGDAAAAVAEADAALAALSTSPLRARLVEYEAQAQRWRGEALLRLRRPREAAAALDAALRLVPGVFDQQASPFVAATLAAHARALRALGERGAARERLRAARAVVAACRAQAAPRT